MDMSGIADFNMITLQKLLSDKDVSVTPVIRQLTQGFEGASNISDLETLFQLTHLYVAQPRFDESAFSSYISRMKSQLDNKDVSPETAFADTFRVVSANYHPRVKPMSKELLADAVFKRIIEIGMDRFANPGAFTYFFVGKIDPTTLKELVEKYLASLPAKKADEKWVDLKIRKPQGVAERTVTKGKESKSIQYIQFHGKLNYSSKEIIELDAISKILTTRLLESIREDKASVYYIEAAPGYSRWPVSEYTMTINYGTSPEKLNELKEAVFATIRDLIQNGPKPDEVDKAREKIKRERETNLRENSYWDSVLKTYYLNRGGDFKTFAEFDGVVEKLTQKSLKSAAYRTFDFKNYISVALIPEKVEK
jgi:zinc protease